MKYHTILLFSLAAFALHAEEWTGAISESGCGLKHADGGAEGCVTGCVKKGAAPVFVTGGKVYKIANGEKVMNHLGKKVKLTGKLENETVTVDALTAAQ
ncbi:MAG: hypothetical protein IT162_09355 [Bryobacterales bacterium]|nr:hypothetical protein [Bryobacterales bacterium]